MVKYLLRLDDACPFMDMEKWQRIEEMLDKYGVKPMVGIIPANTDPGTIINAENPEFWAKSRTWQKKGWAIALHGYDHRYISDKGKQGLNPMWCRSEFAGVSLEKQKQKIRDGLCILRENGIEPKYFFAPSHTFDNNTLIALREETKIRIISDTVATKPYRYGDFAIIPQVGGHCMRIKVPGFWTFCLHPNMMTEENFKQTESFLRENNSMFISFDQIELSGLKSKDIFSRLMSWIYFKHRSSKGKQ